MAENLGSAFADAYSLMSGGLQRAETARRERAATAARGRALLALQNQGQQPATPPAAMPPGQPSVPAAPPPQATPPQAGPPGGAGLSALGKTPPGMGPQPPMPPGGMPMGGQPPPPAAAPSAGAPPSDGMSGIAKPTGNFAQDMQKTVQNIAEPLMKANPHIDPVTLADAVSQQIEMMRGVDNSQRIYMLGMVEQQKEEARAQLKAQEAKDAKELATIKGDLRYKQLEMVEAQKYAQTELTVKGRTDVAQIMSEARKYGADVAAAARTKAAELGASSRVESADISAGARVESADIAGEHSDYRAEQGYRGRVTGESVRAGGGPIPGPTRRPAPRTGRTARTAGGGAPVAAAPPFPAAQHKGATATSPDGKTRWRSDGAKWVKIG